MSVTRLLRGEVAEAKSDLEEALHTGEDEESLMASVVAAGLHPTKKGEADELYAELAKKFPSCPMVTDFAEKSAQFDTCLSSFVVPPPAIAGRA